jgi:hypothetical protein
VMRRALYRTKTRVAARPRLALPIARIRGHGVPVSRDTDIVIEGFPRTGSSFAVAAFDMAQPRKVRVAHHVHAPAQVLAAVRWGIPALVLIREAEDAALSLVVRSPELSLEDALTGYVRFYRPLVRVRHAFEVATLEEVARDFGEVTRRVNQRFGTSFAEFEHTEANAARCLELIEWDYLTRLPPGEGFERSVARPSEVRDRLKSELREGLDAPALTALRSRARGLFGMLTQREEVA